MHNASAEPAASETHAPTIKDVAERAGVSPMTVSRVLTGGSSVRPETRERVERAVRELGYRRNENARSLRPGHRSGLIGVTVTNVANPYYAQMQRGVEEVAARHGRRILVGNSNEDPAQESRLVADFIGRRVEGLIVVPANPAVADHLRPAVLGGTPLAFASRAVPELAVDTVLVDDVGGAYRATDRLLRAGRTRIAFLGTRTSVSTGQRRLEGFRLAHRDRGVPIYEHLVRVGQQEALAAEHALAELLHGPLAPDAVFSANSLNTIGAIRAIVRAHGARASGEIDLAGFDSFEFADLSPLPLSVVAHDAEELGRRTAELLFARIEEGAIDRPATTVELPVELHDVRRLIDD